MKTSTTDKIGMVILAAFGIFAMVVIGIITFNTVFNL
jgi:hypothetical protein